MKQTIFDVGANTGSSCHHYSLNGDIVYAFEPTPYLLDTYLLPKQSANYIVVPKAVSYFDGEATFNIAGHQDWGCSSLNTFSDNLNQTWGWRTDLFVTNEIQVKVIKLKSFIQEHDIKQIDILHIDTQGSDLDVLKGLEDQISIVQSGVIEVPSEVHLKLYKEQPSKEESIEFLNSNGFKIKSMEYQGNEYNIYFHR